MFYKTGALLLFLEQLLALDAANEIRDNDLVLVVVGDTGDKDPTCETVAKVKTELTVTFCTQLDLTADVGRSHKRNNVSVVLVLIHGRPISFHDGVHSFDSSYILNHTGLILWFLDDPVLLPHPFYWYDAGTSSILRKTLALREHRQVNAASSLVPITLTRWWNLWSLPLTNLGLYFLFTESFPQRILRSQICQSRTTSSLCHFSARLECRFKSRSAVVAVFYSFRIWILRYPTSCAFTRAFVNPGESVVANLVVADRDLHGCKHVNSSWIKASGHVGDCAVTGVLPQSDATCSHVQVSETVSIHSSKIWEVVR